jgi:ribonuclease HI
MGERLEVMDAELVAAYHTPKDFQNQGLQGKEIHAFVDSQTALKRLPKISLTRGQKICHEITELCKQLVLHGNKIHLCWVPGRRNIQGNEHADWLAKAGLKRKAKDPFPSLSYLKRKAKKNILAGWKQDWKDTRPAEKGKVYTTAVQNRPHTTSYKMQTLTGPKRVQAAYYQLKLGKGFFKQFSKAIRKDDRGECFGNCNNSLQTPEHLLQHCKHYTKERRRLTKVLNKPQLTLLLLFNISKGSAALLGFLQETEIATARWLVAAGTL